jgi:hypothetical protein
MFGFLKNLQAAFQNGCIKIYSHQQCTRAPFYMDIWISMSSQTRYSPTTYCGWKVLVGGLWFDQGLHACKAGTLPLDKYHQSRLLWLFWRWSLLDSLGMLVWKHNPPDLRSQPLQG